MNKFQEITSGWLNLLLGKEKELAESRAKICADCPISSNGFCSRELGGCGCPLKAKLRSPNSECPKGKW